MGDRSAAALARRFVGLVAACVLAFGADARQAFPADSTYAQAVRLLGEGRDGEAAGLLRDLAGFYPSAAAFHNLALAELRLGRTPEAVASLLASDALGGVRGHAALQRAVLRSVPVELHPLTRGPISVAWRRAASRGPDGLWAGLALTGLLGGCILFAVLAWRRGRGLPPKRRHGWLRGTAAALLSVGILALALAVTRQRMRGVDQAVVTRRTELRASPTDVGEGLRQLPAGTPLRLDERVGEVAYTRLPTGESGWVAVSDLLPVKVANVR